MTFKKWFKRKGIRTYIGDSTNAFIFSSPPDRRMWAWAVHSSVVPSASGVVGSYKVALEKANAAIMASERYRLARLASAPADPEGGDSHE